MIAYLKGNVIRKEYPATIINVGGVGYEVFLSMFSFSQLPELNNVAELEIYTHVMEDAITLYGFTSSGEKELFLKLISISKIGCKKALGILSGATYTEIYTMLCEGNIDKLKKLPGIGLKTAQRIIVELKGKVELPNLSLNGTTDTKKPVEANIKSALSNLGYSDKDIQRIFVTLKDDIATEKPLEEIIKKALQSLAK